MSTTIWILRRTALRILWLVVLLLLAVLFGGAPSPNSASAATCDSPSFGSPVNFSAGEAPSAVVASDFDSDRKLDLAVANFLSDDVSVLKGDGSGGFGSPTTVAAGNGPEGLAVGDLNGDRNPDVVVANQASDGVSVLLGNGAGGFDPQGEHSTGGTSRLRLP